MSRAGNRQINEQGSSVKEDKALATGVVIRTIQRHDVEAVRGLVRRLHEKTVFGNMPFSDEKFDRHAETIFSRPIHVAAFVAEHHSEIIGFIWATVGQHTISQEGLIATCHVIAVETRPTASGHNHTNSKGLAMGHLTRRATTFLMLLKAVKLWAKKRGAEHVLVHVTTGTLANGMQTKNAEKLLRKVSATSIGGAYVV